MIVKTPPMGWNTWNTFGDKISSQLLKEVADAFIENGLKDAGYEYIVIDDWWSLKERDENGRLQPDPAKFPDGIKEVADYLLTLNRIHHISFFNQLCASSFDKNYDSNWCGGTGLMLSANYKGEFYPCIRYMESSLGTEVPPYIIGNVDEGIMNTKDSCDKVDCLSCITRSSQSTQECMDCPINALCAWCSGYNYQEFGTPNKRATYICDMHKARALGNVYFWNKFYRINGSNKRVKLPLDDESCLKIIDKKELSLLRELERE